MGLQETSIHSTTVSQPCVKIIIMMKRQSFGDYKRDGLSHVSMLMVTIVNQRHKNTAAMNSSVTVYFYQDELLKVETSTAGGETALCQSYAPNKCLTFH